MRTRYKIIVFLIIISAVLLSIWWQDQKQRMYDRNHLSSYDYYIELTTDSTLSNVTLYLLLPVINNTSSVGIDILENGFNDDDDPSWKYALVDTEHGLMLSIKNAKIEPKYATRSKDSKKIPRPNMFSETLFSNQIINTMNPLGNEVVLMPKYNLTHNVIRRPYPQASEQFDYDSKIYAYYDTSSNANVSISIYLSGTNGWWIGGWLHNSYWENMEIMLSGSQDGWTAVNGQLFTGEGTYDI